MRQHDVNPFTLSLQAMQLSTSLLETWVNANITIASRLSMMTTALMTGRPLPWIEMTRMVTEKQTAMTRAAVAATAAAPGLAAATAALAPYRRATRSNATRLTRTRR